MSNEVHGRESQQERISRLTPAQREMLQKRLRGEGPRSQSKSVIQRRPTLDYPVTAEQEHLWVQHQVDPSAYYFNHSHAHLLKGELNIVALERAINEMVRRHENFRTSLPEIDGKVRAAVAPHLELALERVEVPEFPADTRHERLQALITAHTCRPFDIVNGPLIRATLYRIAEQEHAVLITLHHLITDFVSYDLVDNEFFALYDAFSRGLPSPLPELPVQYGDFAFWLDQWMKSEEAARQSDYWLRKLADLPRLDLVTDLPRPRSRGFRGHRLVWLVPELLWMEFKQLMFGESVTRFTAFLTLFGMLLREYSGKDDIPIATPVSSRKHRETQPIIGYFLNTIVYRLDLSGDPTFHELLQRARLTTLEAMANSDLPFEVLLKRLQVERDPSRAPLVDASYAFGNDHKPPQAPDGLALEEFDPYYQSAWLDINLGVNDNTDHAVVLLDYLTDLFLPSTGERMMLHFQHLFTQAVADPTRRLSGFSLIGDEERQQILGEFNDTRTQFPRGRTVVELFAEQVQSRGNELAVIWNQQQLSYLELDQRSNQLGRYLRKLGVGPEKLVGISMDRSVDMVVAMVGVLKAGGAYVPIDPAYPPDRLCHMVEDSSIEVLVTQGLKPDPMRGLKAHAICLDRDWNEIAQQSSDPLPNQVFPENLVYVIYTSGSTGQPKAIAASHRSLIRLLRQTNYIQFNTSDVVAQTANMSFDPATFEIWGALVNGCRLVIFSNEVLLDGDRLAAEIKDKGVKVLFLATALFNEVSRQNPAIFNSVNCLIFGGEVAHLGATAAVIEHGGPKRLMNAYGPAECTTYSSFYVVKKVPANATSIPIGKPVANTQLYVLDRNMNLEPVGIMGQLYVGGEGLARGYWGRPELTAERFVPDPYGEAGGRLYASGDLARWTDDGNLEFLGRTDNQVKIRGFRVEPAEIEAVLLQHPRVRSCAVLAKASPTGKRLVAYIAGEIEANEVRSFLKGKLPEYMAPSVQVILPELPFNEHGKVDRKALPAPELIASVSGRAPKNPQQEALCSLMKQMLGASHVGPDDNFFSLGGDSILATQLVSRARQAGLIVSLRDVFEQPTVEALAAVSRPVQEAAAAVADVGVGPMPATPIMCWFLESGGSLQGFSQSMVVQIPAGLKEDDLVRALQALLDHHDALRLRFTGAEGSREEWRLEVQEPGAVSAGSCLQRVDIAGLEEGVRRGRMEEEGEAAAGRLSAEKGEMLQAVWFDAGPTAPGRLLLTIHHLSVDGVSWRILLPDLAAAYGAIARGEAPKLERGAVSFRGWAERLQEEAEKPERVKEVSFWREMLEEGEELAPGREVDSCRETVGKAGQIVMTLPGTVTGPLLNRVGGRFRARINEVLLTGLVLSLRKWKGEESGGTSVLIDVEGHGREGIFDGLDLSRTVGLFTSLYPVRLDAGAVDVEEAWAGGKAVAEALKAIKEQLRAVPDNGIGYGLLRYMNAETGAVLSRLVKPQMGFNYLGRFGVGEKEDWAATDSLSGGMDAETPLHHPLQVDAMVLERGGGLELTAVWTWSSGMFREEEVRGLAEGWFEVLGALLRHSEEVGVGGLTPSDVPLVDVGQREIEALELEYGEIEDLLPLSPVQEGLLFHAFYDAGGTDVYNIQILLGIEGPVDQELLQEATRGLLLRHKNLRAAFQHEGLKRPLQIIPKEVRMPWTTLDLSGLGLEERERKLDKLVKEDRLAHFDPGVSPLFRFVLIEWGRSEYRLLMTTHHIAVDGWSVPLMISELRMLYEAGGKYAELPGVVPYRDYLAWLAVRDRKAAENAWREALGGLEEGTRMSPAPSLGDAKIPERRIVALEEELTQRLSAQARAHSLTLNTVIQGVWAVLLSRTTGREDVVFGSTVSGRSPEIEGVETMIGLLINTVPTRVRLRSNDSFKELLGRLNQEQSRLFAHHYLGLAEIQRLTGMNQLFDNLVVFENYPRIPEAEAEQQLSNGVRFTMMDLNDASHYPLVVVVAPGRQLGMYFIYHPDHFSAHAVEALSRRFVRLLAAYADAPDQPVNGVDLLEEQERRQILVDWNHTAATYPSTQTIQGCFALQVAKAGSRIALRAPHAELTYHDLNQQANRLAQRLMRAGVRAETPVAILMERSVDMVVATLAVLKAGGAYLPLHPAYPPERMRLIMGEAGAAVLLLDGATADRGIVHPEIIVVDDDPYLIAEDDSDPDVLVNPDQLAYIMYTSGSTGTPKGVAVTHRNVVSLAFDRSWQEGSLERVLFHSSPAFDASTFEMWAPLLRGKQVIIPPPGDLDIAAYRRLFQEEKATTTFFTASLFNVLAQEAPDCFSGVPEIWAGGDVVPVAAVQRLHERCPGTLVCNGYGPTETTTFATHYAAANPGKLTNSVPIGSPMDNHQVYVLDSFFHPVPVGVPGELFIAGDGVARGYLKQPGLTAERFVPNPFGDSGGRMYRTGDRVRWREDGQVEFLGRNDHQVKLRGYRIELAEIEAALLGCTGVGQAAVVLHEDHIGERRLAAYVVARPGYTVHPAQLRDSSKHALPEYMAPASITVLASLPLNSNGKLDRKALPAPDFMGSGHGSAPRTHAEEIFCSLMKEVLAVPHAGPDDNFFSLGGDSILAIQLVSRARQAGLVVDLRDVFEKPTIEALAAVSRPVQEAAAAVADVGVGPMPATPIMCWFLESGGSLQGFSQSMVVQIPAGLKEDDLVRALQALLDHHDALRLRFTGAEGSREEWRLEVQEPGAVSAGSCLQRVDIAGLEEGVRRGRMEEEGEAAAGRLSAEKGEMLQAVWFDAGPTAPGRLLLTIHHLSVDGVSWRILLPDLATAWAAIVAGSSPTFEPCPVSFRGWAERLNREALNPERVKELSFWTQALKGAQGLVPGDQLVPGRNTVSKVRQIVLTLPPSVTAPLLSRVADAFHARINDVLLTGLVLSILKWRRLPGEDTSVLIDLEGHGREGIFDNVDLSRTVGFFTTMFPVRLDPGLLDLEESWAGGKALGWALKLIKEQLRSIPNNGIGYGLLRYLNPETAPILSDLAKPQIDFNYLGRFPISETVDWAPSESLSGGLDPDMAFHHWLEVDSMVLERAAGPELTAMWTWMPEILSEEDISLLASGWFHMLEALVAHSEQPKTGGLTPSDVPLVAISQSEIDRLENEYGEIEDILPLSPVQEGLLFHAFYDAGGPDVYNVQIILDLEGPLDEKSLQDAAKALLRRHGNLSAAFKHEDLDRPVQIIPSDISLPWKTLDLSTLDFSERERRWAELVQSDRLARFNPSLAPLFRFVLVRCAPREFRLLIMTHHILVDGWSVTLMIPELQFLYEHHGNAAALPRVTAFRDHLAWLASRDRGAAEAAWREALSGLEEGTRISPLASLGDPKIPERVVVDLDEELTRRLTEQARARGLTLNTIVQGAWAVVLSRHTGRENVVFGSTVSGRSPEIAGVENMIGLLINTVPTRVTVRSPDSFNDLVSRLHQEQSRLLAHQYIGLVEIQRLTGLNELFDTLVIFENYPSRADVDAGRSERLRFTMMDLNDATHYPLAVVVGPGQRLTAYLTYHPDHFSNQFVEILGRRFVRLLAAYATAPDQLVDCIDLLDARERQQILVEFNHTHTAYPRDKNIMELFAEQVQRRGSELAVIWDQQQLSYLELDQRSNQLGRYLRKLGVGPEKLVGISMDRSVDMVLAMVGVLKAGGAYVPIDPAYPPDRLRYMVEDSSIEVLLTHRRLAHHMPELKPPVVCLDRDWDELAQQSSDALPGRTYPENLAYVIYTSGSTGRPKATAVSHRSLIRLLCQTNYIQFSGDEVVAQTVNMSFDPSTFEIWGALVNGCRLVIFGNEVLLDVEKFAAEIKERDVKVMFVATALFNEVGRQNPAMFNSVKYLLFGGEAVHPGTAAAVVEHGGPAHLVNAYGPAECTTFSSFYVVEEVPAGATNVPIGKPVANTQLYVLDRNMHLEPAGVMGQLYIGGEGLARGYWGRPELTAERFVPDPYGEAGGRLYASGDLARWTKDGNLEFFGRADNQIKIRSFRVELGEIEAVLLQHAGVRDCAVLIKSGATGKRLVAYVSGDFDLEELKNFLKSKLPEYMVPGVYVVLPELPLNINGKVDRRALPEVGDDLPPTITAVEELLMDIWAEVLGSSRVTVRDNFYDLGGHSLLALRVVSRINDYFQTSLSVRALLEYPVLVEFAQRLRSISARPAQELEKIARIALMVRRMTPEERKAALSVQ